MENKGTPTSLYNAVEQSIRTYLSINPGIPAAIITISVKDFLAQHFTTAMIENPDCEVVLGTLWKRIQKSSDSGDK